MTRRTSIRHPLIGVLLLLFLPARLTLADHHPPLVVGILAERAVDEVRAHWQPVAEHLQETLGKIVQVVLVAAHADELDRMLDENRLDLVLTDPAHYIRLHSRNALINPLVTLVEAFEEQTLTASGGVIVTRADRGDLRELGDLGGKSIAALSTASLGGFQAQAMALSAAGMDIPRADRLQLVGTTHAEVIAAVLSGWADAGFVRTGVIEALAAEGVLDPSALRVLNRQDLPGFPFALSTRLYPGWPIIVTPHVEPELASLVAAALLMIRPHGPVAQTLGIAGFTMPVNYEPVAEIARTLRLPPYDTLPRPTLREIWNQYRLEVSAVGIALLVLSLLLIMLAMVNRRLRSTRVQLNAEQAAYRQLVRRIPVGVYTYLRRPDGNARFTYVSPRMVELAGLDSDTLLTDPDSAFAGVHPGDVEALRSHVFAVRESGLSLQHEFRYLLDGRERWYRIEADSTPLDNGDIIWNGVISDITRRKTTEIELRLAASVFANSYEGILITDADNRIIDVNPAFSRITGYSKQEILGRTPSVLGSGLQAPEFYHAMWQSLEQRDAWRGEIWNRRKDGEVFAENLAISVVRDQSGAVQHYIGVFSDITRLKRHEAELDRMAYYDPLTGLPNRRLLIDRLRQACARARRSGKPLAVCYLDLDRFKPINDQHGHPTGDEVLMAITHRLQTVVREDDTIARLGGDEFVLLLTELPDAHEYADILQRILDTIRKPVHCGTRSFRVSASVGATLFPTDNADADTLLRHADRAMYMAKENGRNRYHLFDPELEKRAEEHHLQLQRILQGLRNGEFTLFYQPKVSLLDGRVAGVEALIRWRHPDRGLLPPGEFLPVLSATRAETELGLWVLEAALEQIAAWNRQGLSLAISINISANDLLRSGFITDVGNALSRHPDVVASHLEFEILESAALGDLGQAVEVLEQCHRLGIRTSLDDFGTGYSSLNYLRRLPVDILKIDQSFVRDMLSDENDLRIVESVVRLAEVFDREVIAEGVETPVHARMLLEIGCSLAQGYGIARPMPAEEIPGWIEQWQRQRLWEHCHRPAGDRLADR